MKGFAVWNPDYEGVVYVHAETRSKARYTVLRHAREYYSSWTFGSLKVKHVPELDDKPINENNLRAASAAPDDCYQRSCDCSLCKEAAHDRP